MKHLILRDASLNGWEYGMLRSFENAIIEQTSAAVAEIPGYEFARNYMARFGHGMRFGKYRKHFPKQAWQTQQADVGWCILMGPEGYRLDLYKEWDRSVKTKILYLYDTLPPQYPLIKSLFSNNAWDILITSFNDAVPDLEKLTGRKWHCIEQAADEHLFQPVPLNERSIHFSSYGRRYPVVHEMLKEFCKSNNLYYDYTTHDAKHPVAEPAELYKQYAWHLSHSLFTFSWPVELTNPARAGHLKPITCRWFEAAAAGTMIMGRKPGNAAFDDLLHKDLVIDIDPFADKQSLYKKLETIYSNAADSFAKMEAVSRDNRERWAWKKRVDTIMKMIGE